MKPRRQNWLRLSKPVSHYHTHVSFSFLTPAFILTRIATDKKLLVTALQQAHNWIARHDRNKMAFWLECFFEEDSAIMEAPEDLDDGSLDVLTAKLQIQNWIEFNSIMCQEARDLLKEYHEKQSTHGAP